MGFSSMIRDLHCTEFQATIGLSVYPLGFGLIPLVSASFSEEFGRKPLYIGSGLGFLLMFPMIALYVWFELCLLGESNELIFKPGRKISKLSLWQDFYKVRLGQRERLWLEGRSLIYGQLRSNFFFSVFIIIIKVELFMLFFFQTWTTDVYFCIDGRWWDRIWTCLCWLD